MKKIVFLLLFNLLVSAVYAADGDLDTSFGTSGRVVTDFQAEDVASEILQLPDGKLLVFGLVNGGTRNGIARYNADGTLDASFGTGGKLVLEHPGFAITAVRLQADGKIVGSTNNGEIFRLNPNGSLDATLPSDNINFRPNGLRQIRISGNNFTFRDMVVQPDGKYLFATDTIVTTPVFAIVFAVIRCNADGTLDQNFGSGGLLTTNAPRGVAEAIEISPDNKIVVAGYSFDTPNSEGVTAAVLRYNLNGTPDTTFSGDGKAFSARQNSVADTTRLAVHADGKIAVAQNYRDPNFNVFFISKFNQDGTPDQSFGTNGSIDRPANVYGISFMFKVLFQPDGKIVAFGQAQPGPADSNYGMLVARYNLNGTPDTSFSPNGSRVTQFPYVSGSNTVIAISQASTGLMQSDGKLVAAGHATFSNASGNKNFTLVRHLNTISSPPVNNPALRIADFDGDGRTDASVFRNGTWFINPSTAPSLTAPGGFYGIQFGLPTDKLAPADYDGDGRTDIAVRRESEQNFYILNSSSNSVRVEKFGLSGDVLTVGDYDGDGKADLSVYRDGAQSHFYFRGTLNNPNGNITYLPWGISGDKPVRGDFDGDQKMDAAVFRASNQTWYIRRSSDNQVIYRTFGLADDKRISGDFDGDGKTDISVFRNGIWYILQSSNNQIRYQHWGLNTDTIAAGDYDGDGKTDVAVWRNGIYYVLNSANSAVGYQNFGTSGDVPIASAFIQ